MTFTRTFPFATDRDDVCRQVEKWLDDRGYSVGRLQGHSPRGILRGWYDIQKWRNLNQHERRDLDGELREIGYAYVVHLKAPPCESRDEEIQRCDEARRMIEEDGDLARLRRALIHLAGVPGEPAKALRSAARVMLEDEQANDK